MLDHPTESESRADEALKVRIDSHLEIESELESLSEEELRSWLSGSEVRQAGRGVLSLPRSGAKLFVKLLPLTALELEPQQWHTTANLFELPSYYQYRLGSCGFGAWRELEVHRTTNQWALSGQCRQFPLLHGWRVLPVVGRGWDPETCLAPWEEEPAIVRRTSFLAEATHSIALFQEFVPQTLGQWLSARLADDPAGTFAPAPVEEALLELLAFTASQGLLHMDAHFENLLTDGAQVYLGDPGLALSRHFELDSQEQVFFEQHENFDRCTVITSLVHALVAHVDEREYWREALRELTAGTHEHTKALTPAARAYLSTRGPVALAIGAFYGRLMADLSTAYPGPELDALLASV